MLELSITKRLRMALLWTTVRYLPDIINLLIRESWLLSFNLYMV